MSCAQSFVNEVHSLEWLGILLARIAVGLLFFLSGRGKLFVPERREQMRRTLIEAHLPFPDFNALVVFAIATTATHNIKASSPTEWLAAFLYLPEPLYLVILIWLFFSGPGWLSVDHLLLSQTRF